jgi:pimeloyl-ACP methyl ester carboxylesterase
VVRRAAIRTTDLRGAVRLAADATTGVTDLVEAVHAGIKRRAPAERSGGLSGMVYASVRGITRGVGGGLDALLGLLPAVADVSVNAQREALVAALNGVLGDHLAATGNPLAITMALRREGRTLPLDDRAALAAALPEAGPQVVVLLHGLCMNDLQWSHEGQDFGAALQRDLGVTSLYLHYNSGLPVAHNGRTLALLLERLVEQWPQPVQRLMLVGHSMGGLLARSAVHQAQQSGHRWPTALSDLAFLGTPHHGAPLERAGHWVDTVLGATPYAAPFARLGRLRSAGITDLRHGRLIEDDGGEVQHVALPPGVRCAAIAATLGAEGGNLKGRLLGDGLVPLASALGRHRNPARRLAFAQDRQWVGHGLGHMDLLKDSAVYAQLLRLLGEAGLRTAPPDRPRLGA